MRLDEEIKAKAEKAAALLGFKSHTEYVVRLMEKDASRVISEYSGVVAEDDVFDRFMQACEQAGISTTMPLPDSVPLPDGKHPVRSFYTIAPSSISRKNLPAELAAKLPFYPVPVYLLAQMAVYRK
jgi:uncharacterized protein (DUF1778 family)